MTQQPPIWWPPKLGDLFDPEEPMRIKIAKAFGGWLAFTICYGATVFAIVATWKYLPRLLH